MADNTFTPSIPLSGAGIGQQTNPWFTVANQFIPRNLHDVIKWARYIILQSPTTAEVLRKYATYPITDFIFNTKSSTDINKCKSIVKSLKLKEALQNIGFEFFSIGNVFISIYLPHTRMLTCPTCKLEYNAKGNKNFIYRKYEYVGTCTSCGYKGSFKYKDSANKDIDKINLVTWTPENIIVNHNPITGEYDYYYKIPNNVKNKVREGDRLFVDGTPKEFLEAIRNNQDFKFDNNAIFHLRNVTTGSSVNGISVPPLLSLFSLVFYQATLRKANEAIATEYLNPMRVVFPQPTPTVDPAAAVSLRNFQENMDTAFKKHKVDKNYILIAPTPIGYQPIGGEGRNLLVAQEIEQAEEAILMSLGVSRELLSGTTNWTSSTVGLRMLENLLTGYVNRLMDLVEWIMRTITGYLKYEYIETTLEPFKLLDDDNLKTLLNSLASSGIVSNTTVLKECGINFKEEQQAILDEQISKARHEIKLQFEIEKAKFLESLATSDIFKQEDDLKNALNKAQGIAEQLYEADEATKRSTMHELKVSDFTSYILVKGLLEEANKTEEHKNQMEVQKEQVLAQSEQNNSTPEGTGPGPQ